MAKKTTNDGVRKKAVGEQKNVSFNNLTTTLQKQLREPSKKIILTKQSSFSDESDKEESQSSASEELSGELSIEKKESPAKFVRGPDPNYGDPFFFDAELSTQFLRC
jgi:hypothetical protein